MGLDMYLERDHYIGGEYDFNQVEGELNLVVQGKPFYMNGRQISSITERVGYWRKANAVHKWFIDTCADGVDECQRIYVSKDQLSDLYDLCKRIKKKPELASDLLPTQSGFFFGDTEYGEWYMQDIEETIEILKPIVRSKNNTASYYYQASW